MRVGFLFGFKDEAKNICFLNLMLTVARLIIWRRNVEKEKKGEYFCVNFLNKGCVLFFKYYMIILKMEAKEEVFDKNFVQNNPFVEKTWFDFNVKLPVCDLDCS